MRSRNTSIMLFATDLSAKRLNVIFDVDQTRIGFWHKVIPVKENGIGKHGVHSHGLYRRKARCSSHDFSNLPLRSRRQNPLAHSAHGWTACTSAAKATCDLRYRGVERVSERDCSLSNSEQFSSAV
jgi:hypothetical protein